jgi:hypothetical protein
MRLANQSELQPSNYWDRKIQRCSSRRIRKNHLLLRSRLRQQKVTNHLAKGKTRRSLHVLVVLGATQLRASSRV